MINREANLGPHQKVEHAQAQEFKSQAHVPKVIEPC